MKSSVLWILRQGAVLLVMVFAISHPGLVADANQDKERNLSDVPKYEVYYFLCASIRWGYWVNHSFVTFPNDEVRQKDQEDHPITFGYIRGPNVEMVFGPGPRRETVWRKGISNRRLDFVDQKTLLNSIGVNIDKINWVVIDSAGYAEAGGIHAFANTQTTSMFQRPTNATFVIQKKEFDNPSAYRNYSDFQKIRNLEKEGHLKIIDGDYELAPGITAHLIGGKTYGNQALSVNTEDGLVVISGTGVWTYENLKYDIPCPFNVGSKAQKQGYKRIREILGDSNAILVPEADMEVFRRFPRISDRVVQIKLE